MQGGGNKEGLAQSNRPQVQYLICSVSDGCSIRWVQYQIGTESDGFRNRFVRNRTLSDSDWFGLGLVQNQRGSGSDKPDQIRENKITVQNVESQELI
jgi:hypothetical protein